MPVWTSQRFEYTFPIVTSSSCVPFSTIFPSSRTYILSAFLIVERRCAIAITVLPSLRVSRERWIAASVSLSTAEVASSKINISGFFKMALAIDILCRWPPESFCPLSPTIVCSLFGSWFIKSSDSDSLAASQISSSDQLTY